MTIKEKIAKKASGWADHAIRWAVERELTEIATDQKQADIEETCKWLKDNYVEYLNNSRLGINIDMMISDYRKDMEKQS